MLRLSSTASLFSESFNGKMSWLHGKIDQPTWHSFDEEKLFNHQCIRTAWHVRQVKPDMLQGLVLEPYQFGLKTFLIDIFAKLAIQVLLCSST